MNLNSELRTSNSELRTLLQSQFACGGERSEFEVLRAEKLKPSGIRFARHALLLALFLATAEASNGSWFTRNFLTPRNVGAEPLVVAREPALVPAPGVAETFRFVWLRESLHPVILRIWKTPTGAALRIVVLSGNDMAPGWILRDEVKELTEADWRSFSALVAKAGFWKMREEEPLEPPPIGGSNWSLEGVTAKAAREVSRWSPAQNAKERKRRDKTLAEFTAACRQLLRLSGLVVAKEQDF